MVNPYDVVGHGRGAARGADDAGATSGPSARSGWRRRRRRCRRRSGSWTSWRRWTRSGSRRGWRPRVRRASRAPRSARAAPRPVSQLGQRRRAAGRRRRAVAPPGRPGRPAPATSCAAAAHQQAGDALGAQLLHGGEGGAGRRGRRRAYSTASAPTSRTYSRERDALVHARRAQLQDHAARFDDQAVAGGELAERVAQRLEGGLRVGGAAGVDGDRPALLLDPGAAARRRSRPGGRAVRRGPPRRRGAAAGACTVPVTASQRSAP